MWQQTKPAVPTFAFHNFDFGCHTAASVAVTKWNWHNSGTKLIGVFVLHVSHFSFMLMACLCFMLIFFQCTYWMLLYNFHLRLFHVCELVCVCAYARVHFCVEHFTFSDRNKHPLCKTLLFWSKNNSNLCSHSNQEACKWAACDTVAVYFQKGGFWDICSRGICQDYCFQCRQMLFPPPTC